MDVEGESLAAHLAAAAPAEPQLTTMRTGSDPVRGARSAADRKPQLSKSVNVL
ncbi:hypothetical protein GCM10023107_89750 [Actinoplanes octamycinicus]|nr:hypothetical protein Aoc01nite_65150 [Actinoplanes octamycinicus]